ncbi:MAG: hypothetical protein RL329_1035 [Bacteroidota bacterium]|jgi:8-oxo-dGTP diphosphatase
MIQLGYKTNSSIVLLRHGTAYLLLKRHKEPFIGHYVPVGGKLEPYESPIQAAKRETYEETGLVIEKPKFCGILVETSPTKFNWTLFVYSADIPYIEPPFCPEGTLEWIEHQALLKVQTPQTDYKIYEYVVANKPFMFNAEYDEQMHLLKMTEEIEDISIYIS